MAITLTENAAKHIQRQLVKRGKGVALRIGVKKAGCTGLEHRKCKYFVRTTQRTAFQLP